MGNVTLVDLDQMETVKPLEIKAHETALSCMTISLSGALLATASEKGTLVRVFDTETGYLLHEFRRGSQVANIYSINFNSHATLLCVSSDHGTIHVFALDDSKKNRKSSIAESLTFLPKYFSSKWSFCKFNVPIKGRFICAFGADVDSVIVVSYDGTYCKFKFDDKGECKREVYAKYIDITSDSTLETVK